MESRDILHRVSNNTLDTTFLNDRENVSDLSFLFKIINGQISFATQLLQLVYFHARTFRMNHARYGYNFVTLP